MTLKELIDAMNQFRDEYSISTDPDIKKLCSYVAHTSEGLNAYLKFLQNSRIRIEQSQMYYNEALSQLNSILADVNAIEYVDQEIIP